MEYAAVFLLTVYLCYGAMRGLAGGVCDARFAAAAALAVALCLPVKAFSIPYASACAIGAYAFGSARGACKAAGAGAVCCIFVLAGQAAYPYALAGALALSCFTALIFSDSGAEVVGQVIVGGFLADTYSVFVLGSGFLRFTAFGARAAYYLIFAAFFAALRDCLNAISRAESSIGAGLRRSAGEEIFSRDRSGMRRALGY